MAGSGNTRFRSPRERLVWAVLPVSTGCDSLNKALMLSAGVFESLFIISKTRITTARIIFRIFDFCMRFLFYYYYLLCTLSIKHPVGQKAHQGLLKKSAMMAINTTKTNNAVPATLYIKTIKGSR